MLYKLLKKKLKQTNNFNFRRNVAFVVVIRQELNACHGEGLNK